MTRAFVPSLSIRFMHRLSVVLRRRRHLSHRITG